MQLIGSGLDTYWSMTCCMIGIEYGRQGRGLPLAPRRPAIAILALPCLMKDGCQNSSEHQYCSYGVTEERAWKY